MGHDAARMALRRLSPPAGSVAGNAPPNASGMGRLVPVTAGRRLVPSAAARHPILPYGGFGDDA